MLVLWGWPVFRFPSLHQGNCRWVGASVCKKSQLGNNSAQVWNAHSHSVTQSSALDFWSDLDPPHVISIPVLRFFRVSLSRAFYSLYNAATDSFVTAMPCFKSTNKHVVSAQRFDWACRQELVFWRPFLSLVFQKILFLCPYFPSVNVQKVCPSFRSKCFTT